MIRPNVLLTLCLLLLLSTASYTQQKRAQIIDVHVQFNHGFMVLDSADYKALKNSDFIKNELAGFTTRETKLSDGTSWTGSYLYGDINYFEFFQQSADDIAGTAAIALGVDHIGQLLKLDSMLKNKLKA